MEISNDKMQLRQQAKEFRKSLSSAQIDARSLEIFKTLRSVNAFNNADAVLFYAPLKGEINTFLLMKELLLQNRNIYLPITADEDMNFYKINDLSVLKEGDFHVLIPPALEEKRWKAQTGENICMIVPGLMFDKKGNRLGYGKGFYDRFIAKTEERCNLITIALSYEEMVKDGIPSEDMDKPIDIIITETTCFTTK